MCTVDGVLVQLEDIYNMIVGGKSRLVIRGPFFVRR